MQLPNTSRYVKIRRVIDGDTYIADLQVDADITVKETIRLNDFDTPESWRPKTKSEKRHGLEAKVFVKGLFKQASQVIVETIKKDGKYGRRISNMYVDCGNDPSTDKYEQPTTKRWEGFRSVAILLREANLEKRSHYED